MDRIADILKEAKNRIDNDDYGGAVSELQIYVQKYPVETDERLLAEFGLIEKLIEYRSVIKDWEYFYLIRMVYQYCEQKYATDEICHVSDNKEFEYRNVIWWCWLQGLERAPEIVRKCYQSLKKTEREIKIITEENYKDYVTLPDYIIEKWKEGIISNTHFSDILRIALLTAYGGTWIDATVFITGRDLMGDILDNVPLFMYSFFMRDSINGYMLYDSWLVHCAAPSRILKDTRDMLYAYWKNENKLMHYFLFHILLAISCRRHPEEMKKIPLYSLEPCHVMQEEMLDGFEQHRWDQILKMSDIHKLTYKYDSGAPTEGTVLDHILHEEQM